MLNPIGFRPCVVTFWTTLAYLALLIPLIVINESVGPTPGESPYRGVNLTEAWLDLTTLTRSYHPYNSRNNDKVRDWLLLRVQDILDGSGVSWTTETIGLGQEEQGATETAVADVVVFNDMGSNVTFLNSLLLRGTNAGHGSAGGQATYFEGTNIYVYIRGSDDKEGSWWKSDNPTRNSKGGTLVNAHYDSVSTGYGATDDGMGVVTVLQLIKHFTQPENKPKRGILAVLNNGEEDGLNGARAAGQTALVGFAHTFLNLEGAGGGGRALLFRTSDQEVTAAYAGAPEPFGTVFTSDLFGLGLIRSATDYSVWKDAYGQRGLDLAFYKPRARYHTQEDDVKHAPRSSLWHMLSAAVHTMSYLSGDTGDTFVGRRPDGDLKKIDSGSSSDGVWFDLFGQSFVLFNLRGMFAWSLTILIAGPLLLMLVSFLLYRFDKYYFFCSTVRTYDQPDYEPVSVGGWKGFSRFPVALVFASALLVGSAFLIRKVNPFIIHSSPYSVWAMMFSLFYFSLWVIMRGSNFVRPSALHRGYAHIWLFVIGWVVLVAATVLEDRFHIGAVYPFVFFESAVFLSTCITLCELFGLPKKSTWGQQVREDHEALDHLRALPGNEDLIAPTPGETVSPTTAGPHDDEEHEDEPELATETTPLVGGASTAENTRTTFATTYRRSISALVNGARKAAESGGEPFEYEQPWSGHQPSWLWWIQFLVLAPFMIILSSQTGLLLVDSVRQTGVDGSNLLMPYLIMCFFIIMLLLPMSPFVHRVTYHVPVFLLVIFISTLLYNLIAFPFSADNRYKAFFQQKVNLDTGSTNVHIHGVEEYIRLLIADLPSASGREITCSSSPSSQLTECTYDGSAMPPKLGSKFPVGVPPQKSYAGFVTVNATRGHGTKARIEIDAVDTKGCILKFDRPVSAFEVEGGSHWDDRFGRYPDAGVGLVKLWRRDWRAKWVVNVKWGGNNVSTTSTTPIIGGDDEVPSGAQSGLAPSREDELKAPEPSGLDGSVVCLWSDINTAGTIPAYDEALKFAPTWVAWTKFAEGLVEGSKSFKV